MLCVGIDMQAQSDIQADAPIVQRYYPKVPKPFEKGKQAVLQRKRSEDGTAPLPPKGLLLLVQFSDTPFFTPNPHAAFDSLANGIDYTYNGATGSAREYFRAQSGGQYVPDFTVVGPVTLPHPMGYYGTNDSKGYDQYLADFVIDACLAAADSVDWTQFDSDNDGEIDLVFLLFAGYGEADSYIANTIWPCKWDMESVLYFGYTNQTTYYYQTDEKKNLPTFNGKRVCNFACSNEWTYRNDCRSGVGTFIHEFSHVLGLPDYYVPSGSPSYTPGAWSLMGYGNYDNDIAPVNTVYLENVYTDNGWKSNWYISN